jgi:hypothetical protein
MFGRSQRIEKRSFELGKASPEELSQAAHSLEPLLPRFDHVCRSLSPKAQLGVRQGPIEGDDETSSLCHVGEPPATSKVVATVCGSRRVEGLDPLSPGRWQRLVAEEIIHFDECQPSSGRDALAPSGHDRAEIGQVCRREARPDAVYHSERLRHDVSNIHLLEPDPGMTSACAGEQRLIGVHAHDLRPLRLEQRRNVPDSTPEVENTM